MTKNIQTNEQNIDQNIVSEEEQLKIDTMKQIDTSKKIRYLLSMNKTVKEIYHLLKQYEVTTKDGNEIRYQHVRNVSMTKLSEK